MKEWHCVLYGQPQGPFPEEHLREMALRGEITEDTLVWNASTPEDSARGWIRAAETEFASFFPASGASSEPVRAPLLSQAGPAEAMPEADPDSEEAIPEEPLAPLLNLESSPEDSRAALLSRSIPQSPALLGGTAMSGEGAELPASKMSVFKDALSARAAAVADAARDLRGAAPAPEVLASLAPRENRLAAFMINLVVPPAFFLIFKSLSAFLFFDMRILAFAVAGVTALIAVGYIGFSLYYLNRDGQSLGKKAMHIKVTDLDEGWIPLWKIAGLRWIMCGLILILLYVKPYLGIAVFLLDTGFIFRKDRRTLHDLIAGTIVVKAQPEERGVSA